LRGGGNNFGVVTRFDLETFEQGDMWGGMAIYDFSYNQSLFKAFENFAHNASDDPDAALISAWGYSELGLLAAQDYEYAKPISNAPVFDEFLAIRNVTNTLRFTNLTNLVLEQNASNPGGFRYVNWLPIDKS
jgi:hypothetical protein